MVSFENTETAFRSKTDKELNRAYWLFRLIGNPFLVKAGKILADLALFLHLPVSWIIKPTVFRYFCGGETIEECSGKIAGLAAYHIGSVPDYSIEGKEKEEDFERCRRNIIATIERARNDPNIPFSVFKVTGLASMNILEKVSAGISLSLTEQEEFNRVRERVKSICEKALEADVRVFADAEESWIQGAIDQLANEMMRVCNKKKAIVYNTFQLYRKDRLSYLKSSFENAQQAGYYLGAKLVRGAYMEKERKRANEKGYPSPIQESKVDTDRDYDAGLKFCFEHIDRIALCAGTHNEKSSLFLTQLMKEKNIAADHPHIYFCQLLGMSDHISYNLSAAGYNVAKYVPFGPVKEVLPYLIRRAQENSSVKGQTGRELGLILKEKRRRKEQRT